MSLENRIKKAKAKAYKLGIKSVKALSDRKLGKAARLEKRSEKKSGKADKLAKKIGAKVSAASSDALRQEIDRIPHPTPSFSNFKVQKPEVPKYERLSSDSSDKPLKKPKDTSRKQSYKAQPRKKQ